VLATGAWVGRCGTWLDLTLPVQPRRAQSLAVRQPSLAVRHLLFGGGIYLAPKGNGTVIVGVARDEASFDVQTTPEGILCFGFILWHCEYLTLYDLQHIRFHVEQNEEQTILGVGKGQLA
jgi:glycine/D-amino acid oxidase-like deaminating enzyme